jgi:hypothetical protein
MKVFVYFNLHKRLFSVKSLEGASKGKVIGYSHSIVLDHTQFKISEAGRQRVIRERKKNVHAGVTGTLIDVGTIGKMFKGDIITYNPYENSTFVKKFTNNPVYKGKLTALEVFDKIPRIVNMEYENENGT